MTSSGGLLEARGGDRVGAINAIGFLPSSEEPGRNIQRNGIEAAQCSGAAISDASQDSVDEFVEPAGVWISLALFDGQTDGRVRRRVEKKGAERRRRARLARPIPAVPAAAFCKWDEIVCVSSPCRAAKTVVTSRRAKARSRGSTFARSGLVEGFGERLFEEGAALHHAPECFGRCLTGLEAGWLFDRLALWV